MNYELIISLKVVRKKFEIEDWLGTDNVLALLEEGRFLFDDGSGITCAEPLDAVHFKKGVRYRRQIVEPAVLHLFRYKSEESAFGDESRIVFSDRARIRSTLRLLNRLDEHIYANDFQYRKSIFSDLVTLFHIEHQSAEHGTGDRFADDVLMEIERNLHKKMDLVEMARAHHYSYVQFARRFKKAVGMSPQDYITGARIKKARYLLGSTDLPVKEIASACGFSNEYYFSSFFRKYNRLPPSAFRKNVKHTV